MQDDMDDDQVLDWLARADVDVQLGEDGAAAAAAAGPSKELPAWFRGAGVAVSALACHGGWPAGNGNAVLAMLVK
jgi:spermidine/putrescine-binding protein